MNLIVPKIVSLLKNSAVGVIPTDTLYGLMGLALNPQVVERIYQIKQRSADKPFIILISSLKDLNLFQIKLSADTKKILQKYWPGKVSIILPCLSDQFSYLHRGTKSLAFRWPDYPKLTDIIRKTGPLVAPSANPEGLSPARNTKEAKDYFGNRVDLYVTGDDDQGYQNSIPSTLIKIENNKVVVLRQGVVSIK